jgi:hypothetical protein
LPVFACFLFIWAAVGDVDLNFFTHLMGVGGLSK